MTRLLIALILASLTTGCFRPPIDGDENPPALFCDIEEKRKFSQAEIVWRTANAPWNLKRDFKTNLTFERECEAT